MSSRHTPIYLLFFVLAGVLALAGPRVTHSAPAAVADPVPPEALAALRDGRFLRASLILRDYLETRSDSAPSALLLAAQAEAGWGDWARVQQLLEGRGWLDGVASGFGWNLLGRSQVELGRWRQGSESLGRYLRMTAAAPDSTEAGIAMLRRAEALLGQQDHAGALEAYDRAAELLPQVADWVRVNAAAAAAAAGDTAAVGLRLAAVDSALAQEWAWRTIARARRNAGDLAGAQAAAEHAAARVGAQTQRAAAWLLVGSLRAARGDPRGAHTAYIRAMNTAQGSTAAIDAARALSEMSGLSAEDRLLIGRVYLRHGNLARGAAGLNAYLDAGRGTETERERLRYDLANAHFGGGAYADAEKALLAVSAAASDRTVAADALYTAARAQYRDNRATESRRTLQRVIGDYADQPAAVRAAYLTADLDHNELKLDRAAEFYRQTIRLSPASSEAAIARMRLGGIALAQGRNEDALREFEQYRVTHATGSAYQQATYWSGEALSRLQRADEARVRFTEVRRADPFTYYGGLASDRIGDDVWAGRLEPSPPPSTQYEQQVERALGRVDLLREIGWDDAATFEMERVRLHFAAFDGALYTLAEALNERGFTTAGVALGWEVYRREGAWNLRLLRIVYPFPFRNVVVPEAVERGIDPFLAAALIRQESMFNPRARSAAGALGLMQVMPRTGAALARNLGIREFEAELLLQPELNVHLGMAYLADQLRAYDNRLDAVLAAYNAGPGRVGRWQQFPEYTDRLLFAERIPYDETRNYVRIVQNNRRLYAALYADLVDLTPDD